MNNTIVYKILRPNDSVFVSIMKHKETNKWSFINLTKNHICPCQFNSIEEALFDLEKYKEKGLILSYKIVGNLDTY